MTISLLHSFARNGLRDPRTDAALLAEFLQRGDEGAFAEIVRRYGAMIFGVCRRSLGTSADAEDAFQATFLVLVQQAKRTTWRESLGPWLYGVAVRVARKARSKRLTRTTHEKRAAMTVEPTILAQEPDDSAAILDEELSTLPDVFRQALVLCELQGMIRKEAATELGIAEGTLSSRLARGKKMLHERLKMRGVVPAIGVSVVSLALVRTTAGYAKAVLQGGVGMIPRSVLSLTEGIVFTMKTKMLLVMFALVTMLGFSVQADGPLPAQAPKQPPVAKVEAVKLPPPVKPDDPVAIIFDNVELSRQAFADHLIRKYGEKELQAFVNMQIIQHMARTKGITVTSEMMKQAFEADLKALNVTLETFEKTILPRQGKTMHEWNEEVIQPRLYLAGLLGQKVQTATEEELRAAFANKWGEKRVGQLTFPADTTKSIDQERAGLLQEVLKEKLNQGYARLFDELKRQADPKLLLKFEQPKVQPQPTPTPVK